jgi:hypothetical protein
MLSFPYLRVLYGQNMIHLIGALLKLMHWPNAEPWLIVGVLTWAVFIVAAIYEVRTSKNISQTEKTMWTVGFVLMAGITALIYLLAARNRIVRRVTVE